MDVKIKTQWVADLRSGDYQQIKNSLWRELTSGNKGYCCLGILMKQIDEDNPLMAPSLNKNQISTGTGIPMKIRDCIKLSDSAHNRVMKMNDVAGKDFNQIADWIEENL